MKRVLLASVAAFAFSTTGCVIEVVSAGDPCSDMSDQVCTTGFTALYCNGTTWVARNCDAECRGYGYTGGSCQWGSYRDECVCSGIVYSSWTVGATCAYNYDSYCVSRNTMYYCQSGYVYSYNCRDYCYTYLGYYPADAFCMFDTQRSWDGGVTLYPDDNCYCQI